MSEARKFLCSARPADRSVRHLRSSRCVSCGRDARRFSHRRGKPLDLELPGCQWYTGSLARLIGGTISMSGHCARVSCRRPRQRSAPCIAICRAAAAGVQPVGRALRLVAPFRFPAFAMRKPPAFSTTKRESRAADRGVRRGLRDPAAGFCYRAGGFGASASCARCRRFRFNFPLRIRDAFPTVAIEDIAADDRLVACRDHNDKTADPWCGI